MRISSSRALSAAGIVSAPLSVDMPSVRTRATFSTPCLSPFLETKNSSCIALRAWAVLVVDPMYGILSTRSTSRSFLYSSLKKN